VLRHRRVHDRFEPGELFRIAEHQRAQLAAIDTLGPGRPGEGRLDRAEHRAARPLHRADLGIGIEHGHAVRLEHCGDRRFAHPDRTGQAEDQRARHADNSARSS